MFQLTLLLKGGEVPLLLEAFKIVSDGVDYVRMKTRVLKKRGGGMEKDQKIPLLPAPFLHLLSSGFL